MRRYGLGSRWCSGSFYWLALCSVARGRKEGTKTFDPGYVIEDALMRPWGKLRNFKLWALWLKVKLESRFTK